MRLRFLLLIFVVTLIASTVFISLDSRFRGNDERILNQVQDDDVTYAKVSEVIDGDTIKLETGGTVRYLEVNSPEIWKLENDKWVKTQECFNQEALNKNKELVLGKTVKLEKDMSEKDKYGRLLRYVWLNDSMVNMELVKEGYAKAMIIKPDTKYEQEILELEKEAKAKKVGLWQVCNRILY